MAHCDLTSTTTLHGIANCDTVKRARAWMAEHGVACTFFDVAKSGVPADRLQAWVDACGWEALLNRKGTTWRKLDDASRAAVVDAASASAVMRAHPNCIKRPVVNWADGRITVGFDAADWLKCMPSLQRAAAPAATAVAEPPWPASVADAPVGGC